MSDVKTIPCKHIFSNGTEFEWFIETQCEKCKRLRNGKCRIYNACFDAQYDATKFPYDDLLDYDGGYAGKRCKHFTDKPIERKRRNHIVKGQLELEEYE